MKFLHVRCALTQLGLLPGAFVSLAELCHWEQSSVLKGWRILILCCDIFGVCITFYSSCGCLGCGETLACFLPDVPCDQLHM